MVRGHRVWSGPGKHCEDDINTFTSSVTRELSAADEIVFCRSRSQGFVVGVEGGREGEMGFFMVLGQLLQEAEIHREATYYYRLMQQQENSLFDNLLGINLFSQWHCYDHNFC